MVKFPWVGLGWGGRYLGNNFHEILLYLETPNTPIFQQWPFHCCLVVHWTTGYQWNGHCWNVQSNIKWGKIHLAWIVLAANCCSVAFLTTRWTSPNLTMIIMIIVIIVIVITISQWVLLTIRQTSPNLTMRWEYQPWWTLNKFFHTCHFQASAPSCTPPAKSG